MAGLCDDCLPLSYYYEKLNLDRLDLKQNRNTFASIAAGSLVCIKFYLFESNLMNKYSDFFSLLLVGG